MANHKKAIQQLLIEKGLFIHTPNDMIYICISRKAFPNWKGWDLIDLKLEKLSLDSLVINNWKTIGKYLKTSGVLNDYIYEYYKEKLWDQILGDKIISQEFSNVIFESIIKQGLISTIKLLKQLVDGKTIEELINNTNNYYLLNPSYLFSINFLKKQLQRYLKILDRYPHYIEIIISLINDALFQINEILDVKELDKAINILTILNLQKFLENKNNSTIESNDILKQLLNNL